MEINKLNYLNNLNKNQKEAIIDLDGPCLIVAGAGSGKTRVLTTRVAHIINKKKAWPIVNPKNMEEKLKKARGHEIPYKSCFTPYLDDIAKFIESKG